MFKHETLPTFVMTNFSENYRSCLQPILVNYSRASFFVADKALGKFLPTIVKGFPKSADLASADFTLKILPI